MRREKVRMNVNRKPVFGSILGENNVCGGLNYISLPGYCNNSRKYLNIDNDIMSKHILLSGGTGSGKTNAFYLILDQLKRKMTQNDVMIIFDTKGDYYNKFGAKEDLILGNSIQYRTKSQKWNLFREILADGWDSQEIENNIYELSWSIFKEAIEKSKNPFFPNAARDLFAVILLCMMERGKDNPQYKKKRYYNSVLKKTFDASTITMLRSFISKHPKWYSVNSYIDKDASGQALGVYSELLGCIRKILTGVFADKGSFSIRDFVRKRGGKVLFIEYDLSLGDTLAPIYSLLIDLALKEVLGRGNQNGNVYMIFDEFKLLPYLQHIDDGVNFGRSLGLKIMAGIQSVNQMTEAYGEERGKNILAGFSSVFSFRANDAETRKFTSDLYGENVIIEQRKTLTNIITEEEKRAHVVEDWDLRELRLGEAVIGMPFKEPFIFLFDEYK